MSHYEERLEHDLEALRTQVAAVAEDVKKALQDAVHALLTNDRWLASTTVLGDGHINRAIREIDRQCHAFVARHLPSAGHLRFVSSVLRLDVALERVGDYAVAIARETAQLSGPPPATIGRDIELLADQNRRMFAQAMQAFNERNAEMARGTMGMAKQLDATFDRVFADLLSTAEEGEAPIRDLFALLVCFNRLERIGDQAKNICEETLFTVTGETKQPKVYRILFIDERDDGASQMAVAFARKAFPNSGKFSSAGWAPADELDSRLMSFLDARGFDVKNEQPSVLTPIPEELADHHVIVSFGGDARPHMAAVPFQTVLLEWDGIPSLPSDEQEAEALLEENLKRISNQVRELMESLRGSEAD